jgi:hypothetical protein
LVAPNFYAQYKIAPKPNLLTQFFPKRSDKRLVYWICAKDEHPLLDGNKFAPVGKMLSPAR